MTLLSDLPSPVLQQIVQNVLSSSSSSSSPTSTDFLSELGRNISAAAHSTLYHTLTLPDKDAIFLQSSSEGTGASSCLDAILRNDALARGVKVLVVTDTASEESGGSFTEHGGVCEPHIQGQQGNGTPDHALISSVDVSVDCSSTSPRATMSTAKGAIISTSNLFFLLTRLPNITSFEWKSPRPLPSALTRALTLTARNLTSFSNTTSPFSRTSTEDFKFTPSSSSLSALPLSLTSLVLSHLSQKGLHNVSRSIRSQHLPNVANLELTGCKFVDDAFFEALAEGVKGLKRIVIKDMSGTKLTESGLEEFFQGCEDIREVIFKEVEGRLSKLTWSSLAPSIPSSLSTVSLTYSDSLPHKTWVLSNLSSTSSLVSLASIPSLHTLILARTALPPLAQDGSNSPQLSGKGSRKSPMVDLMRYEKWKLDEEVLKALVEKGEHGNGWRELDLSLWTIDQDQVKKLLGACASGGPERLGRLRISFDGPFKTLLALTSPLGASLSLRTLVVQIPPHHIPHSSPTYILSKPTTTPTIPTSTLKSSKDEIFPSPKEWKKFLKKSHSGLTKVVWDGREGYGRWDFRKEGAGAWRVDHDPFGGEWEEEGGGGELAAAKRDVHGGEKREVTMVGTVLEGFSFGEDEVDGTAEEEEDDEEEEGGHHLSTSSNMARASSSSSSSSSSLGAMGLGLTGFTFPSYGVPIGGSGSTTVSPSINSTQVKSGTPKDRDNIASFDKDKSFPPLSPSSQYSTIASKKRSPSISASLNSFPPLSPTHSSHHAHVTTLSSSTLVFNGNGKSKSRSSSISSSHTTSSASTASTATTTNSPGTGQSRDRSSTAGSTSTTASSVGIAPETTKGRAKIRSSSGPTASAGAGRKAFLSGDGVVPATCSGKGGGGATASAGGGMSRRRSTGTTNAGTAATGGTSGGFGGSGGLGSGRGRKFSNA